MRVVLNPGEVLEVRYADEDGDETDGNLFVSYSDSAIEVKTDWPDSDGRIGVVYSERFGEGHDAVEDSRKNRPGTWVTPDPEAPLRLEDIKAGDKLMFREGIEAGVLCNGFTHRGPFIVHAHDGVGLFIKCNVGPHYVATADDKLFPMFAAMVRFKETVRSSPKRMPKAEG